jgi:hypothetical protein
MFWIIGGIILGIALGSAKLRNGIKEMFLTFLER